MAFDDYAAKHPLIFEGQKARVKIIPTASYPLSLKLHEDINFKGHTRCLEVMNFPQSIGVTGLKEQLRADMVEFLQSHEDGKLEIRFTSVSYASKIFSMFNTWRMYSECNVSFVSDPCARDM